MRKYFVIPITSLSNIQHSYNRCRTIETTEISVFKESCLIKNILYGKVKLLSRFADFYIKMFKASIYNKSLIFGRKGPLLSLSLAQ